MLAGAERQASVVWSRILLTGIYSIPDLLSAASAAPCSDAFGLAIKRLWSGVWSEPSATGPDLKPKASVLFDSAESNNCLLELLLLSSDSC